MRRVLIAGGPRTGKTTLAKQLATMYQIPEVRCTDDIIRTREWSQASLEVASWLHDDLPYVIEGTVVVRALRRWLLHTRMSDRCADFIFYGSTPFVPVTKDQQRMISGCNTIWNEIRGELATRGIRILSIPTSQVKP